MTIDLACAATTNLRTTPSRRTAMFACLLVSACGGGTDVTAPVVTLPECTGNVVIQASPGTQPTFTWTPKCRAFLLVVEAASTGHDFWSITSPGRNGIAPDVAYGISPSGTQAGQVATPLVAGQAYTVALRRFSPTIEDGILSGATTFTP